MEPIAFPTGTTGFPFHNLEEANAKVTNWKRVAPHGRFAALSAAVDLTVHPSSRRASFPGLSPFEILHEKDILARLVAIPSPAVTALSSAAFGAMLTAVLLANRVRTLLPFANIAAQQTVAATEESFLTVLKHRVGAVSRALLVAVLVFFYVRFVRRRRPKALPVSHYSNCSSSAEGPCIVADRVLMITNSHAGTHADTPQHFSRLITVEDFDPAHYTGDAVVLDLREALLLFSLNGRAITRSVLIEAVTHSLPDAFRNGTRHLWRLLVVTKPRPTASVRCSRAASQDMWDSECAYFEPSAIEYLAETFPKLLLIGIDAPSVDDEKMAPIADGSHGAMLVYGIAILENLSFAHLESRLPGSAREAPTDVHHTGCVEGALLTIFNPVLCFEDSKGCCVLFLPAADEGAATTADAIL